MDNKYYKRSLKTLGLTKACKGYKDLSELKKLITRLQNNVVIEEENLVIARKNVITLKGNIANLKTWIGEYKDLSVSEKKSSEWNHNRWKDELTDAEFLLGENESKVFGIPSEIKSSHEVIEYLLRVEPQIKIERVMDLNKGKKIQVFVD